MSPESRRRRGFVCGTCLPSIKKTKKRGCSGASVAKGWALAQAALWPASPEEDREVGGLSYTCGAGVPRHRVEAPPRTGELKFDFTNETKNNSCCKTPEILTLSIQKGSRYLN